MKHEHDSPEPHCKDDEHRRETFATAGSEISTVGNSVVILHKRTKGTISSATAGRKAKHSDDAER
jgi:hypothetical protein